jgi:hypothetical protein
MIKKCAALLLYDCERDQDEPCCGKPTAVTNDATIPGLPSQSR